MKAHKTMESPRNNVGGRLEGRANIFTKWSSGKVNPPLPPFEKGGKGKLKTNPSQPPF
jgi:hypothetical protein